MERLPARPVSTLSRIIQSGKDGGASHGAMMQLLTAFPYAKVKASSDFAPPGASSAERMNAWEGMPYPQPDTIQEVMVAVQRKQLVPEDLAAIQDAIEARQQQSRRAEQQNAGKSNPVRGSVARSPHPRSQREHPS